MGQVTGIVKLYLDGALQRSEDGAKLELGGKTRTPVSGYQVYGYSEKVEPSKLTFTLIHMGDTDLIALRDLVGSTVMFECDTGITYQVANAFVTKPPAITGGQGKVEVEMQGDPAQQT